MPMTGIVQGFVTGPVPFKSYVLRGSVRRLSYGTYRMATPYLSVAEFTRRGSVVSKNDPEVTMLSIDPGLERRWFWWADINKAAADLPAVTDVRVLGAVGVVELDRTVDVEPVTRAAVARGAWVRPFRRLVYVMPPYVSTDDDVATICAAVTGAVEEVCA